MDAMKDAAKEKAKEEVEEKAKEQAPVYLKCCFPCCGVIGTLKMFSCCVPSDLKESTDPMIEKYEGL
eukprot:scaffold38289_cov32-Prasinocladus_malaysianus.AAC.1